MGKELERLEEGPKAKIHLVSLEKSTNRKTPGHDVIYEY